METAISPLGAKSKPDLDLNERLVSGHAESDVDDRIWVFVADHTVTLDD